MSETPAEVKAANLAFMAFWILVVIAILVAGRRWERVRGFSGRMMAGWKPSLAIALLFLVSMGLGGRGLLNPYAIAVFCQALIGLALAHGVAGLEPISHIRHPFVRVP